MWGALEAHSVELSALGGPTRGSVRWNEAMEPVDVPRVRNTATNHEVSLQIDKLLHQPKPGYEQEVTRSVLFGLSQRNIGNWRSTRQRVLVSAAPPWGAC